MVGKPGIGTNFLGGVLQLPAPQRIEQIARKNDALGLPPREPLACQVIDAAFYCFPHLQAKAAAGYQRFAREQLAIDPGCAWCRNLLLQG